MREPSDTAWAKKYNDAFLVAKTTNSLELWNSFGYSDLTKWKSDYKLAQTDLYWMCTDIFDLALVEETHRPITSDFFIHKNPYIVGTANWKEDVALQSTIKNRLLLYPRSSFKTSIDKIDIIQWIICFPDIRVLVMTAEEDLANAFVDDTKRHFYLTEDKPLTRFQMLFIEHCHMPGTKQKTGKFTSRARKEKQNEPTILALSVEQNTAGLHTDVGKFDDCVSDANSGAKSSEEGRKNIGRALITKRPIVDAYGYRDYIGTPYSDDDGYAMLQDGLKDLFVMKKPAWTVKKGATHKKIDELLPEDVDLLFPKDKYGVPRITFQFLMGEYNTDPYIAACQYWLDPKKGHIATFTEDLLRSHVCPPEGLPQTHADYAVWDLAYSADSQRDYSVGLVGWVDEETARGFVVKMNRGRFSKSELPFQIAKLASDWKVLKIYIEKSNGADFLENDIRRELVRLGYPDCPIDWVKVDTQKGAKNARAEIVENYLVQDRLWFSAELGDVFDAVVREFTRFKPGPNTRRKDDTVDTVGHFVRLIPANPQPAPSQQKLLERAWKLVEQKDEYDRIYNTEEWRANAPVDLREISRNRIIEQPLPMDLDGVPIVCPFCGLIPCCCIK